MTREGSWSAAARVPRSRSCSSVGYERLTPDAGSDGLDAGRTDAAQSDAASADATVDRGRTLPADWWDPTWTHRIKLTFSNASSSERLLDMPVLVVLDATRWTAGDASPTGDDLRFVDSDATTELPYEIDAWAPAGTSSFWVRVPAIETTNADFIWLYYGRVGASAGERPTEVWSGAYAAVWHLEDFHDSTANGNDAAASGVVADTGRIGVGQRFDLAVPSYAVAADSPSFHVTTTVTLSGWAQQSALPLDWPWRAMMTRETGMTVDDELWLGFYNGGYLTIYATPAQRDHVMGAGAPTSAWVYLTSTYDGAFVRLYVNGTEMSGASMALSGNIIGSANPIVLGGDKNPGGTVPNADFYDGILDELRIENVARSPSWITAQYASMTDVFITYGAPE